MTLEQQVRSALVAIDDLEPSTDLWTRVAESIVDDDRRRARRGRWAIGFLGFVATVVGLMLAGTTTSPLRTSVVDWRVMEAVEAMVMVGLVVALGPAIRRFGSGYAREVFRARPSTGDSFLALLDVAYYLVFGGYVLVTLGFAEHFPTAVRIGDQIEHAAIEVAGLLLTMGLLHAATFAVLPLLGLVFTATQRNVALPSSIRLVVVVVTLAFGLAWLVVLALVGGPS